MRIERRKFISYAIGGAALACTGWKMQDGRMKRIVRQSQALGTTISITVYHHDQAEAREAISNAFKAIERVEQMMSLYRADSEVSRLNRDGSIKSPDSALVQVLKMAGDISHRTNGAFDITVQPLWELYSQHASSGSLPSEEEIRKARQSVDWRKVAISEREVSFLSKDTRITLNGIAQGYAADAARSALVNAGIEHALIDSGEIGTHGSKSKEQDWTIGIKHPRQAAELLGCASLEDRCMATSGDYESRFSDDFRNNHLFDPKTGRSPLECASVSVTASTALEADALSTAAFILGPKSGRELIESVPGADALFVDKNGRTSATANFPMISRGTT